jgi:hypothetical protein
MKLICAAGIIILAIGAAQAAVQDCEFLLRQGIKNDLVIYDKSMGKRVTRQEFCSNRQQSGGSGFGIGYGNFSINGSQESQLTEAMCKTDFSETNLSNVTSQAFSEIDPNLVNTVNQCLKQSTDGLQVTPVDAGDDTLVLSIGYLNGPSRRDHVDIYGIDFSGGNISCTGELVDRLRTASSSSPLRLDRNRNWSLKCARVDLQSYFEPDGKPKKMRGGTVLLDTMLGPVVRKIADRFPDSNSFETRLHRLESMTERLQPFELGDFTNEIKLIDRSEQYALCSISKIDGPLASTGPRSVFKCDLTQNKSNKAWTIEATGAAVCRVTCFKFAPAQ